MIHHDPTWLCPRRTRLYINYLGKVYEENEWRKHFRNPSCDVTAQLYNNHPLLLGCPKRPRWTTGGWPQYSQTFHTQLVDGRVLRDLETLLDVRDTSHQSSLLLAIQLLQSLHFDKEV